MRIVVLAGGLSMERNVSLSSGNKICRALNCQPGDILEWRDEDASQD